MKRIYVIFVRHMPHKDNRVTVDDLRKAIRKGQNLASWLRDNEIPLPCLQVNSSAPRTSETGTAFRLGMNHDPMMIVSDQRVGDITLGRRPLTAGEVAHLKAYAAANSVSLEVGICKCPELAFTIADRAIEGTECVRDNCSRALKATTESEISILVNSHGGRIEPVISSFMGRPISEPLFMLPEGDVAVLTLNVDDQGTMTAVGATYQHLDD